MRKATRKQEINIIEHCMLRTNNKVKLHALVLQSLYLKKLVSTRIRKFAKAGHPEVWQWQEYLVTLQLGWRRYLYKCDHKDSIFVKWYLKELKRTKDCTCCLYWRAIAYSVPIGIISFLLGKYLS